MLIETDTTVTSTREPEGAEREPEQEVGEVAVALRLGDDADEATQQGTVRVSAWSSSGDGLGVHHGDLLRSMCGGVAGRHVFDGDGCSRPTVVSHVVRGRWRRARRDGRPGGRGARRRRRRRSAATSTTTTIGGDRHRDARGERRRAARRPRRTPNSRPSPTPSVAPNVATSAASKRTIRRSWRRVMPTARTSPSSRVRSNTDSASVLAMPIRAMTTASATITLTIVRISSTMPSTR